MEGVCTDSDFFFDIFRITKRARSHSVAPASLAPSLTSITAGESFYVTSQEFSHLVWGIFPSFQIPGPWRTHWCFEVLPGNCGTQSRTFRLTALLRCFDVFLVHLGCFLGWGSTWKSFYTDVFASTNGWECSLIHSPVYLWHVPPTIPKRERLQVWGGVQSFSVLRFKKL